MTVAGRCGHLEFYDFDGFALDLEDMYACGLGGEVEIAGTFGSVDIERPAGGVGIDVDLGGGSCGDVDGISGEGEHLFDVVDEGAGLDVPVTDELFGGEFIGRGDFHGEFEGVVDIVEVVLAAVGDYVPVATGNVAIAVDIGEDASAGQAAGVDIAFGYLFPPVGVFVGTFGRSETVPGIVHYLTATM